MSLGIAVAVSLVAVASLGAQTQTMKQLARGMEYAVASMAPRATLTAEHVLQSGGNAFDAIVAGQAVLGIVLPNLNGVGSDATLLIYDAKRKKVLSLNAEGTAPKLATIAWYKANQGGKIPVNDSLLAATVPGVVDAWYILPRARAPGASPNCWRPPSNWPSAACPWGPC